MDYRSSEFYRNIFDYDILFMDINTPLYIFVLVLIVMFFMQKLLFKPVQRTLDARQAHADALHQRTRQHHAEIERLTKDYNDRLDEVRAEVARVRADARRDAERTVAGILERARQQIDADIKSAMADLELQVTQTRAELSQRATSLADEAVTRVLGA